MTTTETRELFACILKNDVRRVAELLKYEKVIQRINDVDENGVTPLYLAAMKQTDGEIVRAVLKVGVTVDLKGADRETPLYIACYNNHILVAEILLAAGANVNEMNGRDGDSALHCAASLGYEKLVQLLLSSGANVNVRNSRLETPLFVAAKYNKPGMVFFLLENNALPTIPNDEGKNPLYIASERQHKHVVALLKSEKKYLKDVKSQVDVEMKLEPSPLTDETAMLKRASAARMMREEREREEDARRATVQQQQQEKLEKERVEREKKEKAEKEKAEKEKKEKKVQEPEPPLPVPRRDSGPSYGGTMRVVGTGTGLNLKQRPPLVDYLPGDEAPEDFPVRPQN